MASRTNRFLMIGSSVVAALSLGACATEDYVDEQIATVNSRIDGVEANLQRVDQSAQAANAAARQASTEAQAAAAAAQQANQRVGQLSARMDAHEQSHARQPRN